MLLGRSAHERKSCSQKPARTEVCPKIPDTCSPAPKLSSIDHHWSAKVRTNKLKITLTDSSTAPVVLKCGVFKQVTNRQILRELLHATQYPKKVEVCARTTTAQPRTPTQPQATIDIPGVLPQGLANAFA
jgi:hypothetical protein